MDQARRPFPWKELLPALIAPVPFFGFFAFLFMGKRSQRRRYSWFGLVYGGLNLLVLLLFVVLGYTIGKATFLDRYFNLSESFLSFALFNDLPRFAYGQTAAAAFQGLVNAKRILYLSCLIHTLLSLPAYLRYMRDAVLPHLRRHRLLDGWRWRLCHEGWLLWSLVPILGGGALVYSGRKLGRLGLRLAGHALILVSLAANMTPLTAYLLYSLQHSDRFTSLSSFVDSFPAYSGFPLLVAMLVPICLLTSLYFRRDVLNTLALQWETDCRAFPRYAQLRWRLRHSLWQGICLLPYAGGIGLLRGGILGRKRGLCIQAVLMLVLTFLWAILLYVFNRIYVNSEYLSGFSYFFRYGFQPAYHRGLDLIALASLLLSCCWRREVLVAKAAELGDYASDLERDIARRNAIYSQWENRGAAQPDQSAEAAVETPPSPEAATRAEQIVQTLSAARTQEPAPAPSTPEERVNPVDLNTCSREELSALPGVGIAGAMRAMSLRQERGGFTSVDEFVDLLDIKPHFAVQLFERATVSQAVQPSPKPPVSGRRRIDL